MIEFQSILEGLHNLPPYTDTHPERIAVRQREKEVLRGRLLRLVEEAPFVLEAIVQAVTHVNGQPGSPRRTTNCTGCWRRNRIGWRRGAPPSTRSTTGASST